MRVFLAIDMTPSIKNKISEEVDELKKEYPYLLWVPEENLHITLHFFGEQSFKDIEKIKKAMEYIVYDIPQFYLYASYLDLFISRKILLYMGFARQKSLEEMESRIKDAFHEGPRSDKKFLPHITLARYKIPSKQQYLLLKKKAQNIDIETFFKVTHVTLYESILSGKIPEYKVLEKFKLPTS